MWTIVYDVYTPNKNIIAHDYLHKLTTITTISDTPDNVHLYIYIKCI